MLNRLLRPVPHVSFLSNIMYRFRGEKFEVIVYSFVFLIIFCTSLDDLIGVANGHVGIFNL